MPQKVFQKFKGEGGLRGKMPLSFTRWRWWRAPLPYHQLQSVTTEGQLIVRQSFLLVFVCFII